MPRHVELKVSTMKQFYILVIFFISLILSSCSSSNGTKTIDYYSYELDNNNTTLISNRSSQINIYAHYNNGETQTVNNKFIWQSSNENAATVSNGLVKTSNLQTNVIINFSSTETLPNGNPIYQDSVTLNIKNANLVSIAISPSIITSINQGVQKSLIATGTFDNNSTYGITNDCNWSSADATIASITSNGVLTALSEGNTTITATDAISNISAIIQVTVNKSTYTDLNISATKTQFNKNETIQLGAVATNSDGEKIILSSGITWASSDTDIVSINSSGLAKALTKGDVNITAEIDNTDISSNKVQLSVKKEKWLQIINNDTNESIYLPYVKDYNLSKEDLNTNQTLATYTFSAVGSDFTLYNVAVTNLNNIATSNAYFNTLNYGTLYSSYTIPKDTNRTIQLIRYNLNTELKYYFSLEQTSILNDFKVTYHD